jgi:hypothetical protein
MTHAELLLTAVCDVVASWAQAVPVQCCAQVAAVSEGHQRGAVPRLHERGVVAVKVLLLLQG